ncbi:hypothetical protein HMPREF1979_01967 [Actinomyces johnsonii F0542]|uniref:Uncharacterized protein n=1 Tax=Actinomyces johnsonii F0542 TaxID=1321818 RepID=U1QMP4_9ACTO|nr:hypothetical protein HMPREF1979_01967 [Actinomyces johnsonii F0542]
MPHRPVTAPPRTEKWDPNGPDHRRRVIMPAGEIAGADDATAPLT